MLLVQPETKHMVDDYEFVFETGMLLPVTVDKLRGDTIDFQGDLILIHLSEKPALDNPDRIVPAEDTTVFVSKLACVQKRPREITELSADQRAEWAEFLRKESGAVTKN